MILAKKLFQLHNRKFFIKTIFILCQKNKKKHYINVIFKIPWFSPANVTNYIKFQKNTGICTEKK